MCANGAERFKFNNSLPTACFMTACWTQLILQWKDLNGIENCAVALGIKIDIFLIWVELLYSAGNLKKRIAGGVDTQLIKRFINCV